eukprot:COSAG01_NODE_46567_length_399_cov_0.683333_1_plen_31_part_01
MTKAHTTATSRRRAPTCIMSRGGDALFRHIM